MAAAATAVSSFPAEALWRVWPLYPDDLSYFDTPITPAPADILLDMLPSLGGSDRQAIEDIAALGFHGIQLRLIAEGVWQRGRIAGVVEKHQLKMVASPAEACGLTPRSKPKKCQHTANAKFVHDAEALPPVTDELLRIAPLRRRITKAGPADHGNRKRTPIWESRSDITTT